MPIEDAGCAAPAPAVAAADELAELAGDTPPGSAREVAERLAAIAECAAATSPHAAGDGIAAFSRLYHRITVEVDRLVAEGRCADPGFLVGLELEFAERYFAALRHHAVDAWTTPRAWRVLFDNRTERDIPPVAFALAGLNAHVNLDLADALLSVWERVGPDDSAQDSPQYRDYSLLNEVFETTVDRLRGELGSPAAGHLADLVVRFTRDLAWDEAREVWTDGADEGRRRSSEEKLDTIAGFLGARLLGVPLPR